MLSKKWMARYDLALVDICRLELLVYATTYIPIFFIHYSLHSCELHSLHLCSQCPNSSLLFYFQEEKYLLFWSVLWLCLLDLITPFVLYPIWVSFNAVIKLYVVCHFLCDLFALRYFQHTIYTHKMLMNEKEIEHCIFLILGRPLETESWK